MATRASRQPARLRAATVWAFISAGLVSAAGCGGSPTAPTPSPSVQLTCPANVETFTSTTEPIKVTYADPTIVGGTAPFVLSCVPASGSDFPLGESRVQCTVTDTRAQTASCQFAVRVKPGLSFAKYLAFGDSLTEGVTSQPSPTGLFRKLELIPGQSYPDQLLNQMLALYPTQPLAVINEGKGGEFSEQGVRRLPGVLSTNQPEVLLLMHGANDITAFKTAAPPIVAESYTRMIREADLRGMKVVVATITPRRNGGPFNLTAAHVPPVNDRIRSLATQLRLPLVDTYEVLLPQVNTLIGVDCLHPTAEGYVKIAEAFMAKIREVYEVKPPAGAAAFTRRR